MKRTHLAVLLLLPFMALTTVQAQSDGVIIPSDEFEADLFTDSPDLFIGDDFSNNDEITVEVDDGAVAPEPDLMLDAPESNPFLDESTLPLSATTKMSVVNVSQNNADALETGARPGDILRYEFVIDSQTENVKNYIAQIDVANLASAVNFTDVGFGSLDGGMLTFPSYSQSAPCNQIYTFFVQVKEDCGDLKNVNVSAEDQNIRVNLNCGLAQVGPGNGVLAWGIALILAAFGMMWIANRRTN